MPPAESDSATPSLNGDVNEKGSLSSLPEDQIHALNNLSPISHSDNPYFVPSLDFTREEEAAVIRILDWRLFPFILLTTFVLNMDRTNNSNAISDNLPADLGFNINVVNTATAMYAVLFTVFCFTGAVIAKIVGPSRCECCLHLYSPVLADVIRSRDTHPNVCLGTGDRCSCTHH